jgi:hypothetical protein
MPTNKTYENGAMGYFTPYRVYVVQMGVKDLNRFTHHITLPFILPLMFFAVAFSPVEVLGCRNRGLLALSISFISGLLALGAAFIGIKERTQNNSGSYWWVLSALILAIPVVGMILLA